MGVKGVVTLRCNKCNYKYTYLDEEFDPYNGNTDAGECHYCYGGTLFYEVILKGEKGFEEKWAHHQKEGNKQ